MKKTFFVTLIVGMVFAAVLACATTGGGGTPPAPDEQAARLAAELDESLRKYSGPSVQTWNDEDAFTYVYYLDPLRFEKFKAELDAGGEYLQADSWTQKNRDWERGRAFARGAVRPDGRFQLELCTEDNSVIGYMYKKVPAAQGQKLAESLRRHSGPSVQTWGDDGDKFTYVYHLDPLRFEEFKAELDAGDAYNHVDSWTQDNRDWDRGRAFAWWAVRPDGSFELRLGKEDNSVIGYRYISRWDGTEDPAAAARLAAEINALKAGSGASNGGTVTLSGDVRLTTGLAVPAGVSLNVPPGVTLDLSADGGSLELRNGAVLTVDGTVNAGGHGDQGKGWVEGGLRIGDGTTVINGSGTIRLRSKGCLLNIGSDKGKRQLTLDGVTLVGIADNDASLVQVGEGGGLLMKSGAITGNTTNEGGGGVNVHNGTFAMSGSATVSGNTSNDDVGGGVFVGDNGSFTMSDRATVSGNTTAQSGGGVFVSKGTFTMSGSASVSGNTSASTSGGVWFEGSGTFTMSDNATVSGNNGLNAAGVSVWNGATFIMSGSASVSGNTNRDEYSDGGVFVGDDATFIMSGHATVSGNNGTRQGGGVALRKSSSTFIMNGGTIYGSSAHLPAGADKSLANTARNGASLYNADFDRGTAKYGRAGGPLTDFGPATANGGLTENGNKGTSRTLSVDPDTGALTVTP